MKSVYNAASEQKKEIKYPCLMVNNNCGVVVLFNSRNLGTVVFKGYYSKHVGYYSANWLMSDFTPLSPSESITLQND